jgi:hypothetical protein
MQNRVIGVIGPKGSGKSHMAAQIMAGADRAAVYQIVREDANYLPAATNIFDGDLRLFCIALGEDTFRYIYRVAPGARRVEKNRIVLPDFELFLKCCFERRNMMMVIDEAHFLCARQYIPAFFYEAVATGRHRVLDIVFVGFRFAEIHPVLTSNADELYLWCINEPMDIEGIRNRCGEEVSTAIVTLRKTEDRRNAGGTLLPGQYIHWRASGDWRIFDPAPQAPDGTVRSITYKGVSQNGEEKSTGIENATLQHLPEVSGS